MVDHSDFDIIDAKISYKYEILQVKNNTISRKRPIFKKDNKIYIETNNTSRVYKKLTV